MECNGSYVHPQGDKTARTYLLSLYPQQDTSLDRLAQNMVDKAMDKTRGDPAVTQPLCTACVELTYNRIIFATKTSINRNHPYLLPPLVEVTLYMESGLQFFFPSGSRLAAHPGE